jgi:serine/threonine protein kinase
MGEGAFGNVYEAKDRKSGEIVAIKKIKHEKRDGDEGIS